MAAGTPLTLLDVRWSLRGPARAAYLAGHIPGAVWVDLDRDLADPPGVRGRHPLPDPDRFGAAMRRAGVSRVDPVVVYDERDGTSAARAWWLLVHHGHPDVRLLDGGFEAWKRCGGPVATAEPPPRPGDFVAGPGWLPVVDTEQAAEVARAGLLVDARAAERYRGEVEPVDAVAGHVPGAVNIPAVETVDAEG